jgi:glycosyltransferase involved in cell wall biosynthesis
LGFSYSIPIWLPGDNPLCYSFLLMKISIVVPAFNEEKLIAETLRCIGEAAGGFTRQGWKTEIIVCDNNSTDTTAEIARVHGARVVFEPVNQIARARNAGAAAATGDWLVFIDADSWPSPALFGDVADQIASGTCIGGGSTVRMDESSVWLDLGMILWNSISRVFKWAAGCFIFCETETFRRIGGFNTDLFASEEIDLSKRIKRSAKVSGKRFVILRSNPLVTSARKMRLYSRAELGRLWRNAIFKPRATVTSREACSYWYDGRR